MPLLFSLSKNNEKKKDVAVPFGRTSHKMWPRSFPH